MEALARLASFEAMDVLAEVLADVRFFYGVRIDAARALGAVRSVLCSAFGFTLLVFGSFFPLSISSYS